MQLETERQGQERLHTAEHNIGANGKDNYKGCKIFHIELVVGIAGHERNRGLGQNRWKERVSNSDLEPRPELVGCVVMLTDVGKTNYPASSGEILIIGSVSLMSDAHRDKLYNMVGDGVPLEI